MDKYKTIKILVENDDNADIQLIENIETKEKYILKIVKKYKKQSLEQLLCSFLKHKNITTCYESYLEGDQLKLVFEYANEGDLYYYVKKKKQLTEEETKIAVKNILNGLVYCHENKICHGDLKPENILVFSDEKETVFKLTDWGTARETDAKYEHVGSIFYLAPEIIETTIPYFCDKTDIWTVGVVTLFCLCGIPIFYAKHDMDVYYNITKWNFYSIINKLNFISEDCKKFIIRLLNRNPKERPTAKEALEDPWLK